MASPPRVVTFGEILTPLVSVFPEALCRRRSAQFLGENSPATSGGFLRCFVCLPPCQTHLDSRRKGGDTGVQTVLAYTLSMLGGHLLEEVLGEAGR